MPSLIWGSPDWSAVGARRCWASRPSLLLWSYAPRRRRPVGADRLRASCKALGFAALALSLLEPLLTGSRPRRGANAFVVLADNSQSLLIRDGQADPHPRRLGPRPARARTPPGRPGWGRISTSAATSSTPTSAPSTGSTPWPSTARARRWRPRSRRSSKRFRGLPLAGVLLFTDGNRTDAGDVDWSQLPPVYPVVPPSRGVARDVGVRKVSISQTNFESAPVVIRADVAAVGFAGEPIVAAVTDEAGKEVERQEAKPTGDGKPLSFRFQFRPERKGVSFYRVRAFAGLGRGRQAEGTATSRGRRASRRSPTTAGSSSSTRGAARTGCST